MDIIKNTIDLTVITRKGVSGKIKYVEYEKLFGVNEDYKNAEEIISINDLNAIEKTLYIRG